MSLVVSTVYTAEMEKIRRLEISDWSIAHDKN